MRYLGHPSTNRVEVPSKEKLEEYTGVAKELIPDKPTASLIEKMILNSPTPTTQRKVEYTGSKKSVLPVAVPTGSEIKEQIGDSLYGRFEVPQKVAKTNIQTPTAQVLSSLPVSQKESSSSNHWLPPLIHHSSEVSNNHMTESSSTGRLGTQATFSQSLNPQESSKQSTFATLNLLKQGALDPGASTRSSAVTSNGYSWQQYMPFGGSALKKQSNLPTKNNVPTQHSVPTPATASYRWQQYLPFTDSGPRPEIRNQIQSISGLALDSPKIDTATKMSEISKGEDANQKTSEIKGIVASATKISEVNKGEDANLKTSEIKGIVASATKMSEVNKGEDANQKTSEIKGIVSSATKISEVNNDEDANQKTSEIKGIVASATKMSEVNKGEDANQKTSEIKGIVSSATKISEVNNDEDANQKTSEIKGIVASATKMSEVNKGEDANQKTSEIKGIVAAEKYDWKDTKGVSRSHVLGANTPSADSSPSSPKKPAEPDFEVGMPNIANSHSGLQSPASKSKFYFVYSAFRIYATIC